MATYLPGVTDYIPQLQPFRPDFNFYSSALQMKQGKYDAAHQQLSNLYGSLLNAPMLREQNIATRDEFFKVIDEDIKKMSSMDLSLQQNVDAAGAVFNQLLDNKNVVKDMVWTRNWQNEHKRAEGFRDCVDPKKCGGAWWDGGVRALNYMAEEFRGVTDQEAMNFGSARFTPYQNMLEKAMGVAKESGLNITMDTIQGGYIVTTKNGPNLVGPLQNLFTGMFANDPAMMDYYKTKAYVDRKDWVNGNVETYGSVEGAESAYVNQMTQLFEQQVKPVEEGLAFQTKNISSQREQLEKKIQTEGTTPGSTLAEQYRKLNQVEEELGSSLDAVQNSTGSMDVVRRNSASKASLGYFDNALAMMYMGADIENAAQTLAYRDFEQKLKADPYALESVRQNNRLALESTRFQNRLALEDYKYNLKTLEEQRNAMGSEIDNVPSMVLDVAGATDVNSWGSEANQMTAFEKKRETIQTDITAPEKEMMAEAFKLTRLKSISENGNGMASQDLVAMVNSYYTELAKDDAFASKTPPEGGFIGGLKSQIIGPAQKAQLERWQKASPEEKVKIAQNMDMSMLAKMPHVALNNTYKNVLLPMMDMNNDGNTVNRAHLKNLWETTGDLRTRVQAKEESLAKLDQWYASESQNVIAQMRASSTFEPYAQYMEHYIDPETGNVRSQDAFARSYAAAQTGIKNGGENFEPWQLAYEEASAMYRGDKPKEAGVGSYLMSVPVNIGAFGLDAIDWIVGADAAQYYTPTDIANEYGGDPGLHDIWKKAWSRYSSADGGSAYLGLVGTGGEVSPGINYTAVDPSKYKSAGTMNTMSFMKNILQAGPDNARVAIGGFSSNLPSTTDDEARQIFKQIYLDAAMRTSGKDMKRPIMDVTFSNIAGGDSEWEAVNIKLNENYVKQYRGSSKTPRLMATGFGTDLTEQGITLYLNKGVANNGFHQGTEKTDVDIVLDHAGEYKLDDYPETTKDLTLKKLNTGGYEVTGNILTGYDANGQPIHTPYYVPYNSPMTNPTQIVQDFNGLLREISLGNSTLLKQYNMTNGIKNPQQLLAQ